MNAPQNIYEYITIEEARFSLPIQLEQGWDWSFKEQVRLSTLYKNSQFSEGNSPGERDRKPFKNITRPILNLRYRAEDIDVKDIVLYVDDPNKHYLSFLVKKYHDDVFVQENDLDTFFDEVKESKIDYGGGLAKDIGEAKPDYVPLQSIAFCDQTDILTGPICIRHQFSPDQLKEMEEKGWGDKKNGATMSIDGLITLAEYHKKPDKEGGMETQTPGKYIEVYELHGVLPAEYLNDSEEKFIRQLQIITYYQTQDDKQGVTLYASEEKENPFKLILSDKIYGRALGLGGAEEIFDPQVWTNYDQIRMHDMLDAVSKIIPITNDPKVAAKHPSGLKDIDNMELIEIGEGKEIRVLDTYPRNLSLFDRDVSDWWEHAQQMGAATDPVMGKSPPSGTPFKLWELASAESHGTHDYRRGKYAKWIEEVYKDWIIPYIAKKITQGVKFLTELSTDEMEYLSEQISENLANRQRNEQVLNGQLPEDKEVLKQKIKDNFIKKGSERFIEILKDELKGAALKVKVNVSNKQKDLSLMTDKLVNIFRFVFSTYDPQTGQFMVFQNKGMVKLFNQILESSGFTPADFSFGGPTMPTTQQAPTPTTEPLKGLAEKKESPIPVSA